VACPESVLPTGRREAEKTPDPFVTLQYECQKAETGPDQQEKLIARAERAEQVAGVRVHFGPVHEIYLRIPPSITGNYQLSCRQGQDRKRISWRLQALHLLDEPFLIRQTSCSVFLPLS